MVAGGAVPMLTAAFTDMRLLESEEFFIDNLLVRIILIIDTI
jgi:hypothetical protein